MSRTLFPEAIMDTVEIPGGYLVPNDSHVGKWQQECGKIDHDEFTIPLCLEHIPVGGTVIDCGAFNGDHSIAYSKKVGVTGFVIALEPGDVAYKCLIHNVSHFVSNTFCAKIALSNYEGVTGHSENENLGASRCSGTGEIPVFTLDAFLATVPQTLKRIDFIKIDCEGWEYKILKGARETIKAYRPTMLIEINRGALIDQGAVPYNIFQFLGELKYNIKIVQPDVSIDDPQFDILCMPL